MLGWMVVQPHKGWRSSREKASDQEGVFCRLMRRASSLVVCVYVCVCLCMCLCVCVCGCSVLWFLAAWWMVSPLRLRSHLMDVTNEFPRDAFDECSSDRTGSW
ncbi:unnamed protein product [Polarella glacialis]|uniref:Transmembrane protein n=1 Tax=Polarella glacialis TaxID=89957 RepID=A0A813FQY2_POLGL|nr:unnamed protein product [Polarella glacialis]